MQATSFTIAVAAYLLSLTTSVAAQSGHGVTTRYWDCCKPSCAWPGKGQPNGGVVKTCDKNDQPLSDSNAKSGCAAGGSAYTCSDQSPWAITEDLAYGFAAIQDNGATCCKCYELTFKSAPIAGKKMIVQATNTGSDVVATQFDIAIPGGGFGLFDACTTQWGATSDIWGAQYGGSASNTCSQFPSQLQAGCGFRWGWMKGADNPDVEYRVVGCPAEIVAKSGCGVTDGASTTASTPKPVVNNALPATVGASQAASSTPAKVSPIIASVRSSGFVTSAKPANTGTGTIPTAPHKDGKGKNGIHIPVVVNPATDDECEL